MHRFGCSSVRRIAFAASAGSSLFVGTSAQCQYEADLRNKSPALADELKKIRIIEADMRARWIKDEENWRRLPPRAWPPYQPALSEVPALQQQVEVACKSDAKSQPCLDAKFNLATAFVFNQTKAGEGLKLYESVASVNDTNGITALGVCHLEGLGGITRDEAKGIAYLRQASEAGSIQATFELGVLHYMGNAAPHIEEDCEKAFALFQQAASVQHTSGLYMTADMLMTGEGGQKDFARAVPLLYQAGERGHRFARQTLLQVLKEDSDVNGDLPSKKS